MCLVLYLAWGYKKIQRVATSTLAAKTVLNSVLDHLSWMRLCWAWMLGPTVSWKQSNSSFASSICHSHHASPKPTRKNCRHRLQIPM